MKNAFSPRVLLIHPAHPSERTYPLGLAYLAAAARNAHASPIGFDLRLHPPRLLASLLRRIRFDYVGISALSSALTDAVDLVRLVRRIQPSAFVVLGGPHATLAPHDALRRTRADAVVRGDGEAPFAALVSGTLDAPGLMLRGANKTPTLHLQANLDDLPQPDRTVFPIAPYYRHGVFGVGQRTAVIASRGCKLDCGYCSTKAASGSSFRMRSVHAVVDEVLCLQKDHCVSGIVFEDDNLMCDVRWSTELFEALARDVSGMYFDLPNGVHPGLMEESTIDLMKRAGVRSLAFGVESMVASDRERMNRVFDGSHLERLVRRARRVGMITTGYFLIGLPGQSGMDALGQISSIRSLPLDMVHISTFWNLPGQPVEGIREGEEHRWGRVRRAMYLACYMDPVRMARLVHLAGGDGSAYLRLAVRAAAWWR